MSANKIVLLDRDGTVVADPPDERIDSVDKIKLLPHTIEALKYLADHGFSVVFVTNQAGIAEGRITQAQFETIHAELLKQLKPSGVQVLRTFVCPHAAEDNCVCRKPKPVLIQRAAKEFGFDPATVYMIGDRESDVMAGLNAGTKAILVTTGNTAESKEAEYIATDLLAAARYVCSR